MIRNKDREFYMFIIGIFLGMSLVISINILRSLYENDTQKEYLDTMKINGIEIGKKNIDSYLCTSEVKIEDYRGKCGNYDCNIWFKGEGECAYTYKE